MWMGGPWHTCLLVGGLIAILVLTCCCLFRLRARLLHGHWCPSREELLPSAEPHGRSRWWCWGGGGDCGVEGGGSDCGVGGGGDCGVEGGGGDCGVGGGVTVVLGGGGVTLVLGGGGGDCGVGGGGE